MHVRPVPLRIWYPNISFVPYILMSSIFYFNFKALKNFTGSLLKVSIISLHLLISFSLLTHSFPVHPFSTPWKYQKTVRFLMFSVGRERVYSKRMGWKTFSRFSTFSFHHKGNTIWLLSLKERYTNFLTSWQTTRYFAS